MRAGTSLLVAVRPAGNFLGRGGGPCPRLGQEQGSASRSMADATLSGGHSTGTDGKFGGIAPKAVRASRHRNAFLILLETYISCLVDLKPPEMSLVDTSAKIPPSTPKSSDIAPRMDNFTGTISDLEIPMAKAVLNGTIEL